MFRLLSRKKPAAADASAPAAAPAPALVPAPAPAPSVDSAGDEPSGSDRRIAPRRDVPLGPAFRAEFVLLGRARSLSVDDVSIGGVGLRGSTEEGRGLFLGQKIPQARLILGGQVVLVADLEVRIRRSFRSFLAGEQVHIGCRFIGLSPSAGVELDLLIARLADRRGA